MITHGSTPTLTFRFLHLPRSLSGYEIQVYFQSLDDSEKLLLRFISSGEISDDGEAEYVLNTTSLTNGSIIAEGRFSVGGYSHKVDTAVGLTCKNCMHIMVTCTSWQSDCTHTFMLA